MGKIAGADMLSKRHQEAIDFNPITLGEFFSERDHRLFGCGGLHVSPAIGHTMNVNVHADEWFTAGNP